MEIAGITLRVLEIITVVLCGIRLAVPPGHFRWEKLWTKVLYWILIIFWIAFNTGNIHFFKFSSLQETIVNIGVFITLCIFFDTYFWQLFVQFFIYNYTVYIFRVLYIFILCYLEWTGMALDSDVWNGSDNWCIIVSMLLHAWRAFDSSSI